MAMPKRQCLMRVRRELCSQLRGLVLMADPETRSIRTRILLIIAHIDSELDWMS